MIRRWYHVRYVHKIAPKDTDTLDHPIVLRDDDLQNRRTLAAAVRRLRIMQPGARVSPASRIESSGKIVLFPTDPIWHAIVLTPWCGHWGEGLDSCASNPALAEACIAATPPAPIEGPAIPRFSRMSHQSLMSWWSRYNRPTRFEATILIGDRRPGFTTLASRLASYASNLALALYSPTLETRATYRQHCELTLRSLPADIREALEATER